MEYFTFNSINNTGIAQAIYTPMGLGNWSVCDPEAAANYSLLGKQFGLTADRMVRTKQIHSADVRVITEADAGEGIIRPLSYEGCDGLVTNVPDLILCTVEADCTPVYLLDPVKHAVAMIHSGWRGTAGKISLNAVSLMHETYGTEPSDIIAAIGPCICRDCYEVSDDLIPPFEESFGPEICRSFFTPLENGKYLLDLKEAVRKTLILAGVKSGNIEDSGHCTCHENMFYSWRRDKDPDVRMLTAIRLLK